MVGPYCRDHKRSPCDERRSDPLSLDRIPVIIDR